MNIFEGEIKGEGLKIAIVVSRFNSAVTDKLLEGALSFLKRCGVKDDDVDCFRVPGSYEIPLISKILSKNKKYDCIIALGAVIRGDTPHFEYVASAVSEGIIKTTLETETPIIFGIVTADDLESALERAGGKQGNKGKESAETAVEIANLYRKIKGRDA